jgi:hypothetical protein
MGELTKEVLAAILEEYQRRERVDNSLVQKKSKSMI